MYYFIIVTILGGILAFNTLGRMEDPDFTIKQMIVQVAWPGATAKQIEEQVTDKIERKIQETPNIDYVKSYSTPGKSIIFVSLRDDKVTGKEVRTTWLQLRNMVQDMAYTLPQGVQGPFFNDRFDDVYGSIYALSGEGFTYEELRSQAEKIRREIAHIENVAKIDLLGVQNERIFIEVQNSKLAQMGVAPATFIAALQGQNSTAAGGMLDIQSTNVYLRATGLFQNMDDVKALPIRINGKTFRLGDIAQISRAYSDPPDPQFFHNSKPSIGIAISMQKGGNILHLGKNLQETLHTLKQDLPLGMDIDVVTTQPEMVQNSIGEFTSSLFEAIIIVLVVSFISLGVRSGIVVALCIPLVIAATFIFMSIFSIDLHKISLGALIISLGLLVDDAIIAIEMMIVKLEQGWSRFEAACHAYTVTSFPMLTGTLITCAGFIPVGFSKGSPSEFVGSLFTVITISLIISWFVSVLIAPMLGYRFIPDMQNGHNSHNEMYNTGFYKKFKKLLTWSLQNRKLVLWGTLICFILTAASFKLVKQEFFPASTRQEIIVEMRLPQGSSFKESSAIAQKFATYWQEDERISSFTHTVGQGMPRFVLPFNPVLPDSSYTQFIIITKKLSDRAALIEKAHLVLNEHFPEVRSNVKIINTGMNSDYPVMLRVRGTAHDKVQEIAQQVATTMANTPHITNAHLNWSEKTPIVRLDIDQDKARTLGVTNQTLASTLQALVSGAAISEFKEADKTIYMILRLDKNNITTLEQLKDTTIFTANGRSIPLSQIAKLSYDAENELIWRRDLKPTVTVQASTDGVISGNDATSSVFKQLKELRSTLPVGYTIEVDGTLENSQKAFSWLMRPVPIMIFVIITLLMFQLQSMSNTFLTLLTAPLGIIGVTPALLITGSPMGFVVQLGILALSGIIMRNTVILIDQIGLHIAEGEDTNQAVINAAVTRFRPIMLTAAAAILAMIPLMRSTFWGPMAVAIAGGLTVATVLTLLVFPTMYTAWYRTEPPK